MVENVLDCIDLLVMHKRTYELIFQKRIPEPNMGYTHSNGKTTPLVTIYVDIGAHTPDIGGQTNTNLVQM